MCCALHHTAFNSVPGAGGCTGVACTAGSVVNSTHIACGAGDMAPVTGCGGQVGCWSRAFGLGPCTTPSPARNGCTSASLADPFRPDRIPPPSARAQQENRPGLHLEAAPGDPCAASFGFGTVGFDDEAQPDDPLRRGRRSAPTTPGPTARRAAGLLDPASAPTPQFHERLSLVPSSLCQAPGPAAKAVGQGLRELHDALPVLDCPFDWSAENCVAKAV